MIQNPYVKAAATTILYAVLLFDLSNACWLNCRVFVADRNHNRVRVFDAETGKEVSGAWSAVFASAKCEKPSVWSVRIDAASRQIFVANSNFGAGSSCPAVAVDAHSGRVAVLPLPPNGPIVEPGLADVEFVDLAHGFPHEICVDNADGVRVWRSTGTIADAICVLLLAFVF